MRNLMFLLPIFLLLFACTEKEEDVLFDDCLTEELDSFITEAMTNENLPSVTVSVMCDGEIYSYCGGYENLQNNSDRKMNSQFRIASITKSFTAVLILMLANDGLLSTDDFLVDYLPEFPNADIITIKNLLMMRSGIADYANPEFLSLIYDQPFSEFSQDSLIAMSAALSENFTAPDEKTVYCNVNYTILGKIVELVSGNDLQSEYQSRIIEPYQFTKTYYPEPGDYSLPGSLHGYCWEEDHFEDYTELNPLWAGAAGAMISSTDDLHKYVKLLFYGFDLDPQFQQEHLQTQTFYEFPDWFQYGEGIAKLGHFYGHNGTIFGFCTDMWYLPEMDASMVISVNRLDLDDFSQATQIFLQISKMIFPEYVNW